MKELDRELYDAIVAAESAVRRAHDLCYKDGGHGAGYWLRAQLGKAQSILMHYVVKYAGRETSDRGLY
jgi:hypothetical protein